MPTYTMDRMRVALFGGTFDPIHRGHLAIAIAAADTFALDQVLFAPTGRQPLKSEHPAAAFAQRLAMVQAACSEVPLDTRLVASAMDAPRPGGQPNYTVDLLRTLRAARPDDTLFVLGGADSFLTLRKWREPDALLELAEWIVVSRPGFELSGAALAPLALSPQQRRRVHLLTTVHQDISATVLRRRLACGERCDDLLPPAVAQYIQAHNLYRNS